MISGKPKIWLLILKNIMITTTIEGVTTAQGNFLAGGTDYMDRLRHHLVGEESIDLSGIAGLDQIEKEGNGRTLIGALTTIFNVSQAMHIRQNYAGLADAAGGLATPQIRQMATIGGNLTQANRCQYYRHPHLKCTKKGDATCGSRDGYHHYGIIFDTGGCTTPHPSTLAVALLAYDAQVQINGSELRPISAIYGDGSDHGRDHLLADNEMISQVVLPAPAAEKAAYFRAIARARAEWPLVECVVRLILDEDKVSEAYVAVGGVAPVPMRLPKVEQALVGKIASEENFASAAGMAADGASPLPQTGYKVTLLMNTVEETLLRAIG
ncbi:MAG: xanthine dehydrogenase YagS FAD-binding subunit [Candidatus Promineifilaceae bacterium]